MKYDKPILKRKILKNRLEKLKGQGRSWWHESYTT